MSLSVSIRFCLLILAILGACSYANTFSVNYLAGSEHPQLVNADTVIKVSPSALHIADLYARLSGISPILSEGTIKITLNSNMFLEITFLCVHSFRP